MPIHDDSSPINHDFQTTQWSIVLAAGDVASSKANDALGQLFERYWYPLFAFARRQGYSFSDAQDHTQAFFTAVFEKDFLQSVRQEGGKFRSFLLTVFTRFLAMARRAQKTRKRGGKHAFLSLDFEQAEARYQMEPFHEDTPERLFEKQWALMIIDRVLALLQKEYVDQEKAALFDQLKTTLTPDAVRYAESASALGMTEGAYKTAVHRFRRRFAEQIRREIADTVNRPEDIESELRTLFETFHLKMS